jgi:hypothetical protein
MYLWYVISIIKLTIAYIIIIYLFEDTNDLLFSINLVKLKKVCFAKKNLKKVCLARKSKWHLKSDSERRLLNFLDESSYMVDKQSHYSVYLVEWETTTIIHLVNDWHWQKTHLQTLRPLAYCTFEHGLNHACTARDMLCLHMSKQQGPCSHACWLVSKTPSSSHVVYRKLKQTEATAGQAAK